MSHKHGSTTRSRLGKVAIAAMLAVPAALLTTLPAAASPAVPDAAAPNAAANGPMTHPERDFAGSTIAAHEGVQTDGVAPKLQAGTPGIDVSHWQGSINWGSVAGSNRFVYMKATEGTTYRDPNFNSYYAGSYNAGMIRGAYHFATPNSSSGTTQADYFVSHGGGWSADGHTMPPMLDIEYNPYGATCYGLSAGAMSQWIADFSNRVHALTTRWPVIYTTTDWWNTCTGGNSGFGANNPLFIARYASSVGTLPPGWGFYTIWQYSSTGSVPGVSGNCDVDTFNGSADRLLALANNTP